MILMYYSSLRLSRDVWAVVKRRYPPYNRLYKFGDNNSHFGMISLWERLSSREKSWQDATLTAFWNKTDVIMRIADSETFVLTHSMLCKILV